MTNMYDWMILVYLGGDNNLGEEMVWAIKDMEEWRNAAGGNIKVRGLFDTGGPPIFFDLDDLERLKADYLERARGTSGVETHAGLSESPLVQEAARIRERDRKPQVQSVKTTLKNFIQHKVLRAKHYMLVLNGHGSGAIGDFLTGDKRISGLTIPALGEVLQTMAEKTGQKPDILGLDSCQMSMAEVACQIQGNVKYMIGSEGFQPNTGWPYQTLLQTLNDTAVVDDPGAFAEQIVRQHINYYLDFTVAELSTDISVLDVDLFAEFQARLANLIAKLGIQRAKQQVTDTRLRDRSLLDAIVLAHREAQGYKKEQYIDVWDFCHRLSERLNRLSNKADYANLITACEEIKSFIDGQGYQPDKRFVRLSGYSGPQFQHSHGISIFFPWANLTDAAGIADLQSYGTLRIADQTCWDEFLRLYLEATKREVRTADTTGDDIPSLLNQRTGLYLPAPGKDPEGDPLDKTKLGTAKFESMKNPPIYWRKWFVSPEQVEPPEEAEPMVKQVGSRRTYDEK